MKKGIVLSVREGVDKKTNESQIWVSVGILPSKSKETGKVFSPLASNMIVSTVAGKDSKPEKFESYKSLRIGSIVDIHLGINDFTDKTFVDSLVLTCKSPFSDKDLYGD